MNGWSGENPHQKVGNEIAKNEYLFSNGLIKKEERPAKKHQWNCIGNDMYAIAMYKWGSENTDQTMPGSWHNAKTIEVNTYKKSD